MTANSITDFNVVGKPHHRLESRLKVTGQAVYTADMTLPGMVYGAILRSPHAHAKVTCIDKTAALKVPGVVTLGIDLNVIHTSLDLFVDKNIK